MLGNFFNGMMGNLNNMGQFLKLAKDENFRKFLAYPKVQELMKDPQFKTSVQSKDMTQLMNNTKFTELMKDPEIRNVLQNLSHSFKQ